MNTTVLAAVIVAASVLWAALMIARALESLTNALKIESETIRARFCDFAFDPRPGESNRIAELSQLRSIRRRLDYMSTGSFGD
jgi:hypothetical protein